jgi:UDP-galactopyranose mutase
MSSLHEATPNRLVDARVSARSVDPRNDMERSDGQGERARAPVFGRGIDCDLVCLSHLRWGFVYQRPQHLLTRCARTGRVLFVEEPIFDDGPGRMEVTVDPSGVRVCVPHLPLGLDEEGALAAQSELLDTLLARERVERYVLWYYTPMALGFSAHLAPEAVIYDCMDELSAFAFAPAALKARERELMSAADLVFTGGLSLYDVKRALHASVYAFPSSVDVDHFARARHATVEPSDQAPIPGPRLGFFGVVDERMDLALVEGIARARPQWSLVMLGPVVKIDAAALPRLPNIHWLGAKSYAELPEYLSGWDVAMMPFALNESTRFISPTKTPEYLASGRPVVSTAIQDVIRTYGEAGLVKIAHDVDTFVAAAEVLMTPDGRGLDWTQQVDELLSEMSWDLTWARMASLIRAARKSTSSPGARQGSSRPGRRAELMRCGAWTTQAR